MLYATHSRRKRRASGKGRKCERFGVRHGIDERQKLPFWEERTFPPLPAATALRHGKAEET